MLTLSFVPLYGISGDEEVQNIIGKKRNIQRIFLTNFVLYPDKTHLFNRALYPNLITMLFDNRKLTHNIFMI